MKNTSMRRQASERRAARNCILVFILIGGTLVGAANLLRELSWLRFGLLLFPGFLSATYLEYHLHRFWTHAASGNSQQLAFRRHQHHHTHPSEIRVTALQRVIMLVGCAVLVTVALRINNHFSLVAGFAVGACWSFLSHWILHQRWSAFIFPRLLHYHICHHLKFPDTCFGFSCHWWDLLFGSLPPARTRFSGRVLDFYFGGHDH